MAGNLGAPPSAPDLGWALKERKLEAASPLKLLYDKEMEAGRRWMNRFLPTWVILHG